MPGGSWAALEQSLPAVEHRANLTVRFSSALKPSLTRALQQAQFRHSSNKHTKEPFLGYGKSLTQAKSPSLAGSGGDPANQQRGKEGEPGPAVPPSAGRRRCPGTMHGRRGRSLLPSPALAPSFPSFALSFLPSETAPRHSFLPSLAPSFPSLPFLPWLLPSFPQDTPPSGGASVRSSCLHKESSESNVLY